MHVQALISLNAMYDKQRCAGQAMPCEAEFRAYHLLTLIGTHGKYRYDGTEYQGALAVSGSSFMCTRQAQNLHYSTANWHDAPGVLLAWHGVTNGQLLVY